MNQEALENALDGDIELSRGDRHSLDAVFRHYRVSRPPSFRDSFRKLLTSTNPKYQAAAVLFFTRFDEDDEGELLTLYESADSLTGQPDPWYQGATLRQLLASALANRAADPRYLEVAKREALQPGSASGMLYGLLTHAPEWVGAHSVDIVQRTPDATQILLRTLHRKGVPITPLVQQLKSVVDAQSLRDVVSNLRGRGGGDKETALKALDEGQGDA